MKFKNNYIKRSILKINVIMNNRYEILSNNEPNNVKKVFNIQKTK